MKPALMYAKRLALSAIVLWSCCVAPVRAQQPIDPQSPTSYYSYPFGSETSSKKTLSVEDAVNLALSNAASYQQSLLDERGAAEDVRQARAAFFPTISAPLTYLGTTPSTVRQSGDPVTFSFVSASAINESIGFISATGTIDLAGRLRATLHKTRALLAAAHAGTLTARRALVLSTIDAYFGLALARERRRIADETLALAEAFASLTESQVKRGEGEETDMLRARSAAQSRRDELEQARLTESVAMSQLRILSGVDFSTHVGVVRLTSNVPAAGDFLSYTEESIGQRPELAQIEALERAALDDKRAAKRELLPQMTYTLNGGFDAANFTPLKRYAGGAAFVSVGIPIFNFGASKSRAIQAQLRAQSLGLEKTYLTQQLKLEFYAARAGALSALERIKETAAAARSAQANLDLVFDRYQKKKSTLLEVIDAQSNYSATRLSYYQAIADYRLSRARLEVDPTQKLNANLAPPPAPTTATECALSRAQAPEIGGFRLGMTKDQVRALVPALKAGPANEFGVEHAELKSVDLESLPAARDFFDGVQGVSLEFTDGLLSFIRVFYPVTSKWESKDEFLGVMAPKFNLRGTWKAFYDWQNKDVRDAGDLRDLGIECSGFRLSVGIGNEGLGGDQTPHYELDDLLAAQTVREREVKKGK
ncbi:MAG: outer membrane protein [Blastocatellia bacterium]|nr:outer membrane protein [Blastocatellia bacterium]